MAKTAVVNETQPQPQQALSRVYMDVNGALHLKAKMLALSQGLTLKGWMEKLMAEAVAEHEAQDKESTKRDGRNKRA